MALTQVLTRARASWAATLLLAGLAAPAVLMASPATAVPAHSSPAPTVGSVTHRLDQLASQAEALTERYNAAQVHVAQDRRAVTAAQHTAAATAAQFTAARQQLVQISLAQYQGGAFSRTGAILTSGTDQNYLDTLSTQDLLATHAAAVTSRVQQAAATAGAARSTARTLLARDRAARDALKLQRDRVIAQTATYKKLLATLTAAQRQAYTTRNAPTPTQVSAAVQVHADNAAAQRAVDFALAQVGKPYVFASAGPDSFDCSGLTMQAWRKGGVSLPHFAAAQYNYGTHVSFDALQPGDLVFLYSDLHHVEIYIGKGLAVSAPQPGENVKIIRVADSRSDFVGATRLT